MDDFEALRRHGWIDDPADRVRLERVHQPGCRVDRSETCRCTPRLVLRAERPIRRENREILDHRPYDFASGE